MSSYADRLIGGRYQIDKKLAEGGMGEVFVAHHNLSKKKVALKILFPHIGKDEAARQRFLREVSAPAQIGHEGIVEVYDAGFDTLDGSLFVAMEFIEGEPLRDRLARGGVPLEQLLDWFEEMLSPLAAAHNAGIVHRDLKPENVMLQTKRDGSEAIKVLDFGIARDLDSSDTNVTQTGIAMGTPHYMAPEQAMSAKGVTAAADVWALGVMLYEALLGKPPFDGETASAIVVYACTKAHTSLTAAAPHVPHQLAVFVDRLLAKEPLGRPQTAGAMLQELRQVRQQLGGGAVAAAIPVTGHSTGPMSGVGAPAPMGAPHGQTPAGTAILPAMQTPAPGGYGTPPPGGAPGGYGTAPPGSAPGYGTAPPVSAPGYGTAPPGSAPGYGTAPPGSAPGYGTPPPGTSPGFGTSAPGLGTSAPGGFGSQPSYGTGVGQSYVAAPKKSGGMAIGLIAAVLLGGLVLVGGGIIIAAVLLAGDDETEEQWSSTGNVTVQTDIASGELIVDGTSRGPVVPGQLFRIVPGAHNFEIREAGSVTASGTLTITAGQEHTLTLNRSAQPIAGNPVSNPPGNDVMIPGRLQTFNGDLRPTDQQLAGGKFYDTYDFQWTAGSQVQIDMDSSDFDTYLTLRAPSGTEESNDDRDLGANNLNSTIRTTVQETGTYRVTATSFPANLTGDYRLNVRGP